MTLAMTLSDYQWIQDDENFRENFNAIVNQTQFDQAIFLNTEKECAIVGWDNIQFQKFHESYGSSKEDTLAQLLANRSGVKSENIEVVFLEV